MGGSDEIRKYEPLSFYRYGSLANAKEKDIIMRCCRASVLW